MGVVNLPAVVAPNARSSEGVPVHYSRPDCRSVTAVWALSSWSVPRSPHPLLDVMHPVHYNARTTASVGSLGAAIFSAPRRTLSPPTMSTAFPKTAGRQPWSG
jgi:hypothetical protein